MPAKTSRHPVRDRLTSRILGHGGGRGRGERAGSSLPLQPTARLHPVEVAVDVELQQYRWMVRRSSGYLGINTDEPELRQVQLVEEDVDHANRIILANPIFQAFRKERALSAIRALDEAFHQIP